jgi:hypothetical protein
MRLKRKKFTEVFLPFINNGKQIWVINRVSQLPDEIVQMTLRLADLDFIKYIRVCDETLAASSENYPNRLKVPITHMNHPAAIGIQIIYHINYKSIDFYEINSPRKGNGSKMVDAILKDFPKDWHPAVIMDWSNGFWDKIKEKHNDLEWIM